MDITVLIIKILFSALWITAGYEVYKTDDSLMHMMITAIVVSIPLYFMWFIKGR